MARYNPNPIDTSTIALSGDLLELTEKLAENAQTTGPDSGWRKAGPGENNVTMQRNNIPTWFPMPPYRNQRRNTTEAPRWRH
jgi:hypothetical protein